MAWVMDIHPEAATNEAVEAATQTVWQRLSDLEFQRQRQVDELWCVAVCCSAWQCVVVCCSVLQ